MQCTQPYINFVHKFEVYEEPQGNCSQDSKLLMQEMWIISKCTVTIIIVWYISHVDRYIQFPI